MLSFKFLFTYSDLFLIIIFFIVLFEYFEVKDKKGFSMVRSVKELQCDNDFNPPYILYSALMGLLMSSGASLHKSMYFLWFWEKEGHVIHLTLSNTDLSMLEWLISKFNWLPHINLLANSILINNGSGSNYVNSAPSNWLFIVWQNWNSNLANVLPTHFAFYFSVHTLAFWAMRSGKWENNRFVLNVGKLTLADKELLVTLLKTKLDLDAYFTKTRFQIRNPEKVVALIKPLFHESQLYRLEREL